MTDVSRPIRFITNLWGSNMPAKDAPKAVEDEEPYNPFNNRNVENPTTNGETLVHLLKGCIGSGVLSMPFAFAHAGLWFGLIATVVIGIICTYCVHILVACSHLLCFRAKIPSLRFGQIGEVAFETGPQAVRKYAKTAGFLIDLFLVLDLIGACCVYNVFVASNIKQVVDHYHDTHISIRLYICMLLVPLLIVNSVRILKFLAPFSLIANILMLIGIVITLRFVFLDMPSVAERPFFEHVTKWPMFFGNVIFALEGIGVVMSLENKMKDPKRFIGCPGILNIGMFCVVALYSFVGFSGYLKYGGDAKGSITLNIPLDNKLAQSAKLMIAVAIFLTYTVQFYVPMEVVWSRMQHRYTRKNLAEYCIRYGLITLTVIMAVAIPNIGPFLALVGAVTLSFLGLIFPAIIQMVIFWEETGSTLCQWLMIKNIFLILFGLVGFTTGTYVCMVDIISSYFDN